ncbi:hypothetical protein QTP86_024061 [Hemibagrus guttatus]|nr:hypothetical protein QTP86_024061 [Hemibagrus guttatus]
MFWHSSEDINVFTEAVVGFIGKLADDTVQKTIIRTFPNQKPWVDKTIHDALRSCTAAYNTGLASGDMDSYKAASNVWKVVKEAKQRYGRKLESQLQQSDSRSLWQGLRTITDYKAPTSGMSNAYACLADELNIFYARFEAAAIDVNAKANTNAIANAKANASGYRQEENANTENAFIISKHDVKSSVNTRIAAGLDRISALQPPRVVFPLLYSLYTYECVATTNSTKIIKFADDTVVVRLISDNNEMAYLEEIRNLENWCQRNNLLLNITMTKELIVDLI